MAFKRSDLTPELRALLLSGTPLPIEVNSNEPVTPGDNEEGERGRGSQKRHEDFDDNEDGDLGDTAGLLAQNLLR